MAVAGASHHQRSLQRVGALTLTVSSRRDNVDQLETFPPRGVGETLVERDDLKRRRTALGGKESRGKLEGVGSPQRMNATKPNRVLADDLINTIWSAQTTQPLHARPALESPSYDAI
jgi:hypothetical protein